MENELINIDRFHDCTAVVMDILYKNFPNPKDIDVYFIEPKSSRQRALVNYDDEQRSWGNGEECEVSSGHPEVKE